MTWKTPEHIVDALTKRIKTKFLFRAYWQAEQAQEFIGKVFRHRDIGQLVAIETDYHSRVLERADISFSEVKKLTELSVKKATDLLEDRVNRNIGQNDILRDTELSLSDEDLIEGYVRGVGFDIKVRLIWNYRYGENSANGVLTIYPQFRGNRSGMPVQGREQRSEAAAAKEAAKAQRQAEKEARRAALRAKFAKAPERLARECEKDIRGWGEDHPTAPQWEFIATEARALTENELDWFFDQGCRTSGDLESKLERRFREHKAKAAV